MGRINTDQSHQVIATLMMNVDWSKIDFAKAGLQDAVIRDPKGAGARFTAFLNNGANMQTRSASNAPAPKPASKPSVLKPANDHIEWADCPEFDHSAYYQTRSGLYVYDDFRANVVAKAGRASVGATVGRSFDLTRNAYDREIERDPQLGEDYIFTETEVCARIKQMTEKQPNGEEGELLNNGFANIFYLAGCVVSVHWSVDDREWNVFTWKRDGTQWFASRRVFSRN